MERDDLISKAALLKDLSYCAPELWQDEEYIKAKIMKQPTIPAIPVEWLCSQLKNNPNDIESAYDDICINELIDRWQKEQEAQQ